MKTSKLDIARPDPINVVTSFCRNWQEMKKYFLKKRILEKFGECNYLGIDNC